ncbi:hypothetical protein [Thalassobacillus sp. CUG 92003]|uniref:hypothetical protein n=1 Tax=Thalassobacillus sp. CUG 92003 TaxID=2736641 RepID=UPI0015E6B776|nr:hypothetical protein [Thalassobacillus sp. CUG 92003]
MSEGLTENELAAIRERADNATEGPWTNFDDVFYEDSPYVQVYDGFTETGVELVADCKRTKDADFIAHSREDIPKLLAEIDRLHAELDKADREVRKWAGAGKRGL